MTRRAFQALRVIPKHGGIVRQYGRQKNVNFEQKYQDFAESMNSYQFHMRCFTIWKI